MGIGTANAFLNPTAVANSVTAPKPAAHTSDGLIANAVSSGRSRLHGLLDQLLDRMGERYPNEVLSVRVGCERKGVLKLLLVDFWQANHTLYPALEQDLLEPAAAAAIAAGFDIRDAVAAFKVALAKEALKRTGGNKSHAARLLRVGRNSLVRYL